MGLIRKITQETSYKFLNFFTMDVTHKNGKESQYYVASRARKVEDLKAVTHENHADGVAIYSIYGEKKDKVVLIRQYRYPLGGYVYEFPAGLVEPGEAFETAAVREMKEETGLDLQPVHAADMYTKPRYTTIGLTDESCAMVYGYASGECSLKGLEESEELEIVIADKEEIRRILKEEQVALICSYMLVHFLHAEEGHAFDFLEEE